MLKNLEHYSVYLASQSPRRQSLLKELGVNFRVLSKRNIDETYPSELKKDEIALFLAKIKAEAYHDYIKENNLIITADTIVWHEEKVLGKPSNYAQAFEYLKSLSGKSHWVITGVCLSTKEKISCFASSTEVHFSKLDDCEIDYYIKNYKPYDKAGAYGIQEWIGFAGVDKIKGSYFNVMGLPVQQLYEELKKI